MFVERKANLIGPIQTSHILETLFVQWSCIFLPICDGAQLAATAARWEFSRPLEISSTYIIEILGSYANFEPSTGWVLTQNIRLVLKLLVQFFRKFVSFKMFMSVSKYSPRVACKLMLMNIFWYIFAVFHFSY